MSALPVVPTLSDAPVPPEAKGWRPEDGETVVTSRALRTAHRDVFDGSFTFPVATVEAGALAHNIAEMAAYCRRRGVFLAPHGKATMAPQIAHAQLEAGAWGITVATVQQAMAYHRHGVDRILIANQVTDQAGLDWLVDGLAEEAFEPIICVDSVEAVDLADSRAGRGRAGRSLRVLVELGHPGGRTGARSLAEAEEVARAASTAARLALVGVTGYEGTLGHTGGTGESACVRQFCSDLVGLGKRLAGSGVLPADHIVSAGGSLFFAEVCDVLTGPEAGPVRPVLRSGAYVIHDHGHYAEVTPGARGVAGAPDLRPTTTVWAPVLSVPEAGLALLLLGRRDVGFDTGLPVPLTLRRPDGTVRPCASAVVTELNDQHAFMSFPEAIRPSPGDLVRLGISHPCTTFDKWRVIPLVHGDTTVVDLIHTFF